MSEFFDKDICDALFCTESHKYHHCTHCNDRNADHLTENCPNKTEIIKPIITKKPDATTKPKKVVFKNVDDDDKDHDI